MDMLTAVLYVVGGFVLLTGAAEALVYGASSVAQRVGLSPLVIGLTIVSVGTSLPELVVGIQAAIVGSGDIALGNVVGSNIGNVALILGVAALVHPLQVQTQVVRVDAPVLVVASLAFVGLILDGGLGRLDGVLLVASLIAYMGYNLRAAGGAPDTVQETVEEGLPTRHAVWVDVGLIVLGIVGLLGGAHLLVKGAVDIAQDLGVGPIIIGLTVIAIGTSLPELATSVVAARRGEGDIAVGNAIGSSVFNILGILGVTVLVQPLSTLQLGWTETGIMVGTAVLIIPLFRTDWTLSRREGSLLVLCYLGYLGYLVTL